MTTHRDVMQQALEALEYILPDTPDQRMKKDAAIAALRTALAEQPAPVTDAETIKMAEAAGMSKPTELMVNDHWMADTKDILQFAALVRAAAVPPGHVVVKDEPVAWVEVVNTYEGPYNFHGKELLAAGKHDLYAKVSAARPGDPNA